MVNDLLFIGLVADSLTQCAHSLNLPANCAANIASILGTMSLIAQSVNQMDYVCVNRDNITEKIDQKKAEITKAKQDIQRDVQEMRVRDVRELGGVVGSWNDISSFELVREAEFDPQNLHRVCGSNHSF